MPITQKRCVIYARRVRASINDKELFEQEEECRAYIKRHENSGWVFVEKIYYDDGISGMSLNRPGINQLIDDAKQQKFDYIVMICVSRLSRELINFEYLCETLRRCNVEIYYMQQESVDIAAPLNQQSITADALQEIGKA
jgi:site-specific DNA recombinase